MIQFVQTTQIEEEITLPAGVQFGLGSYKREGSVLSVFFAIITTLGSVLTFAKLNSVRNRFYRYVRRSSLIAQSLICNF